MADTIRDVVIRIAIQQQQAALNAPNVQPAIDAAKKVESAFSAAYSGGGAGGAGGAGIGTGTGGSGGGFNPFSAQFRSGASSSGGAKGALDSVRAGIAEARSLLPALEEQLKRLPGLVSEEEIQAAREMHSQVVQAIADQEEYARILEISANRFKEISISEKIAADARQKYAAATRQEERDLGGIALGVTRPLGRTPQTGASPAQAMDSIALQIAEAEAALPKLDAFIATAGTKQREAAQATRDAAVATIAGKKEELAALQGLEAQRVQVFAEAAEKLRQIRISEKVAADERGKESDAIEEQIAVSRRAQVDLGRFTEGFRSAGEGAFRAARGVALWTATNDDSYQAMIKNVAAVQGMWDIFSGGIQTIKGVSAALTVASAAGGIYTFTMTQVGRAQAWVTATSVAMGAAIKAAWGPIGVAVAVASLAITAGSYAWGEYAKEEAIALQNAKPLVTELELLGETLAKVSKSELEIGLAGQLATLDDQLPIAEKLAKIEEQKLLTKERIAAVDIANANRVVREGATEEEKKAGIDVQKGVVSLQEKLIAQERERLALLKEQKQELEAGYKKQQDIAQKALEIAERERERVSGIHQGLGRLNPLEQEELKRYGETVKKGGTLSDPELRRLEELGGEVGKGYAGKIYEGRGKQLEGLLKPFGGSISGQGSKLEELQRKAEEENKKAQEMMQELTRRVAEIDVNRSQTLARVAELLKNVFAAKSDIEMLVRKIEEMERDQNRRDVSRGGG